MEKYGTYEVFKNKKTGEILREPFKGKETLMEKKARKEENEWIKLEEDPQLSKEKEEENE